MRPLLLISLIFACVISSFQCKENPTDVKRIAPVPAAAVISRSSIDYYFDDDDLEDLDELLTDESSLDYLDDADLDDYVDDDLDDLIDDYTDEDSDDDDSDDGNYDYDDDSDVDDDGNYDYDDDSDVDDDSDDDTDDGDSNKGSACDKTTSNNDNVVGDDDEYVGDDEDEDDDGDVGDDEDVGDDDDDDDEDDVGDDDDDEDDVGDDDDKYDKGKGDKKAKVIDDDIKKFMDDIESLDIESIISNPSILNSTEDLNTIERLLEEVTKKKGANTSTNIREIKYSVLKPKPTEAQKTAMKKTSDAKDSSKVENNLKPKKERLEMSITTQRMKSKTVEKASKSKNPDKSTVTKKPNVNKTSSVDKTSTKDNTEINKEQSEESVKPDAMITPKPSDDSPTDTQEMQTERAKKAAPLKKTLKEGIKAEEFLEDQQTYREILDAYESIFKPTLKSAAAEEIEPQITYPETILKEKPNEVDQTVQTIERSPFLRNLRNIRKMSRCNPKTGIVCLNGGTCMKDLTEGKMHCLCQPEFEGQQCELLKFQ